MQNNTPKKHFIHRAAVGTAKAWYWSIGLKQLVDTALKIGHDVVNGGTWVARTWRKSHAPGRVETFEQAVERMGLTEEYLLHQARAFSGRAYANIFGILVATCWEVWLAWYNNLSIPAALIYLGIVLMCLSQAVSFHFRYCQIRDQELYAFSPWFFNFSRW